MQTLGVFAAGQGPLPSPSSEQPTQSLPGMCPDPQSSPGPVCWATGVHLGQRAGLSLGGKRGQDQCDQTTWAQTFSEAQWAEVRGSEEQGLPGDCQLNSLQHLPLPADGFHQQWPQNPQSEEPDLS